MNFLVAAKAAIEERLYAPCVAMSYSAAYSTLTAFLALNGRLWVDDPRFHRDNAADSSPPDRRRTVVGRLTMENKWIYEQAAQSHRARWRDLVTLFTPMEYPIPFSFQRLFSYVYANTHKPCDDLVEFFAAPSKYRYEIREVLHEFLGEIPEMRHRSLYLGTGGDPDAYDALANRDEFDESLLSFRAKAIVEFAYCFAAEVCRELSILLDELALTAKLREKIEIRMHWPVPLDEPRLDLLANGQFKTDCVNLWEPK